MSRLINYLLALARADAGRRLERRIVSLDNLLSDVYRQAQMLAKDVTIHLGEVEPVEVLGDADHLRQLLLILVENAIKYNRPGGQVHLSLGRDGSQVWVAVADTGLGISTDVRSQIFERFFRAPSARQEDGTGLGLSIAKWIADEHEGQIDVDSVVGAGSTFTFRMPSLRSQAAPKPVKAGAERA
jgi:signal transduction histidine kinase